MLSRLHSLSSKSASARQAVPEMESGVSVAYMHTQYVCILACSVQQLHMLAWLFPAQTCILHAIICIN